MATTHSEEQAKAQLASIRDMIAALDCDYDRLEELRGERTTWVKNDGGDDDEQSRTEGEWAAEFPDEAEELAELEAAAGDCEDQDAARQRIDEDPLSIEVRSDWTGLGDPLTADEFCILLCTGGPACRIVGDLSGDEPTSARLEHQDWGTPWTEYFEAGAEDVLLAYARQFLFAS